MKPTGIFVVKEKRDSQGNPVSLLLTGTKHKTNPTETIEEARKRRVRLSFKPRERDQAELELARLRSEAMHEQIVMQRLPTKLNPSQLSDAENARNILPPNMTLTRAAELMALAQPKFFDVTLSELTKYFEDWADVDGVNPRLRPRTLVGVKSASAAFQKAHGNLKTSILVNFNFQNWLTSSTYFRAFSALLTWAARPAPKRLPYIASNPILKLLPAMPRPVNRGTPKIMPIENLQRMLDASFHMFAGALAGPLVLLTWVVTRPNETWKTSEDFIDLEEAKVWIPPRHAKRHDLGEVDLMPNALYMLNKWLSTPGQTFESAFKGYRKRFAALKVIGGFAGPACPKWLHLETSEGLLPWVPDYCRHTGLTYHFKMTGKKSDTSEWGRTGRSVLGRCYVGKSYDRLAVRFWLMLPVSVPRKDRVKVYADTLLKLSTTRLLRATRAYLIEKGIPQTWCPGDPHKWNFDKISKTLADVCIAEEKTRLHALSILPKPPIRSRCPDQETLSKVVANLSFVKAGEQLGVSNVTVARWCKQLNIVRHYHGHHCAPPLRVSDEDFTVLCNKMSLKEIMRVTGYSRSSVNRRAFALKIRPQPQSAHSGAQCPNRRSPVAGKTNAVSATIKTVSGSQATPKC